MLGLLRSSRIAHRFSTEYVLARRVNGKLEVAEFDRSDKDFCFNPRMTARVSLNGEDGLVKIGGVYKESFRNPMFCTRVDNVYILKGSILFFLVYRVKFTLT